MNVRRFFRAAILLLFAAEIESTAQTQTWGRLANPGFNNQRIKSTLFFAGQARDGATNYTPYCGLPDDAPFRTLYPPSNSPHLNWQEYEPARHFALNQMIDAGINVINMSSWGERGLLPCSWYSAPMQTSPDAHDELFATALYKPLLIIPFIESRLFPTNEVPDDAPWTFFQEFPRRPDGSGPTGAVSQIVDLVNRYLKNPANPSWATKWARVYDQTGEPRYAVTFIHAGSNLLGPEDHAAFAAGFDPMAEDVYERTGGANGGVKVGFFIDALPADTGAMGVVYKPSPEGAGLHLKAQRSILGIQCFAPEVHIGSSNQNTVLNWKRDFSRRWFETGIPFILDVSSGYDGHLAFTNSVVFGLNIEWLNALSEMNASYGRGGVVFNSWNGFSEAMVALPNVEYKRPDGTTHYFGSFFYDWYRSLTYIDVYAQKPDAPPPRDGTLARPYTLPEALLNVPDAGVIGLLPTFAQPFDAPIPIQKPCTIISIGGVARIGQ